MAQFVPRLTRPEAGNKYYITKGNGGYSNAVKGQPTDSLCDVLSNCVGYAYGRFNEIGGYGKCKYLSPTNAENFIQHCGGLTVGQTPKLGACMVWRKGNSLSGSDGAGHVAIVEKIISDTQIVTSESGWNSSPFWTKTRNKGDGNWGAGTGYTFLGFIYNPAVSDDSVVSGATVAPGVTVAPSTSGNAAVDFNTSVPSDLLKFEVGDIVEYTGNIHFTNARATSGPSCRPGKVKITARFPNGFHQYHVIAVAGGGSSAYGWVDADKLKGCDADNEDGITEKKDTAESTATKDLSSEKDTFQVGDIVNFTGTTHYVTAHAKGGPRCNPGKAKITGFYSTGVHPYHLIAVPGGGSTVYGWVDADCICRLE